MPTLIKTIGNRNIGPTTWRNAADTATIMNISDSGAFLAGVQDAAIVHTLFSGVTRIIGPTGADTTMRVQVGDLVGVSIIDFGDSADSSAGRILYGHTADSMAFRTASNGANKLEIQSTGSVLIGQTGYTGGHTMNGDITVTRPSDSNIQATSTAGNGNANLRLRSNGSGTPQIVLTVDGTGVGFWRAGPSNPWQIYNGAANTVFGECLSTGGFNFGATGTSPDHRFNGQINAFATSFGAWKRTDLTTGTGNILRFDDGSSDVCGLISINATANTTAYGTSSDARLKTNLQDFDALEMVSRIQAVEYERYTNPGIKEYGFIAQNLIDVLPQAVIPGEENEDGEEIHPWMVDYSQVAGILMKAVQELKELNVALESRLAALEA